MTHSIPAYRPTLFGMVTTRSSSSYTPYALQTFFAHTPFRETDSFILIDNDNDFDETLLNLYPAVQLIRNNEPKGFATNMNVAVQRALREKRNLVFLNNDIIFSSRWFEPLSNEEDAILSPLSNREIRYNTEVFRTKVWMRLEEYVGSEHQFEALVEAHRQANSGYYRVMALPFFCVKVPLPIMEQVGLLDESFGVGGAEDYDYCLRAVLKGFMIRYAVSSYVLHFGGKSSWEGAETRKEQDERELKFRAMFGLKWGMPLLRVLLFEDLEPINCNPQLKGAIERGDHRTVVESLMTCNSSDAL